MGIDSFVHTNLVFIPLIFRLAGANFPVFGYPNLIRFSWSTTREALDKSGACKVKWYDIFIYCALTLHVM